jgi:RNA polymerase sporulation-specific sigma factor
MEQGEGRERGQEKGREDLVVRHLALVKSLVRRVWQGRDEEDLFQVGVIGLIKAARNYDPGRGAFSTYAVPVILGEIRGYLREDNLIKISRDLKQKGALLKELRSRHLAEKGREPTVEEAAACLGLERDEVLLAHEACLEPVSLQEQGSTDRPLEELLAAEARPDVVEKVLLQEALDRLQGRERQLILLRYFQEKSQEETGKVLQLSQMQVSRWERKILRKLRENML